METIIYSSKTEGYSYDHAFTQSPKNANHWHHNDHNEIFIFVRGNSKFAVEGTTYPLKPFDVLIVQNAEMHRVYHMEPPELYERYVIHLANSFFVKNQCEDLKKIFIARPLGVNNRISGDNVKNHYIIEILEKIDEYVTQYDHIPDNVVKGKIVELLFHLNQLYTNNLKENSVKEAIKDIILFINEHIGEKLTLDVIAEQFFVSKSYLCHLFKKQTGLTVNQYIKHKRLIRVKELCSQGMTLAEASVRAGFGTYSNFYKIYTTETGRNPSEDLK